jgi:ribosomal protein S18 acetylase RimI-like enzyme
LRARKPQAGGACLMSGLPEITLVTPASSEELEATRELFREYAVALGVDLCFQNFDHELDTLPGDYREPTGALLLAYCDGELAGCGALRPLPQADEANGCEMKRLYVRRAFRRFGLGRMLAETLLGLARSAGYSAMYLDTLDDMEAARELYVSLGFEEVPPYYYNPIPGAHYLRVDLDGPGSRY